VLKVFVSIRKVTSSNWMPVENSLPVVGHEISSTPMFKNPYWQLAGTFQEGHNASDSTCRRLARMRRWQSFAVEDGPNPRSKFLIGERLADHLQSGVEPTLMNDGVSGVPGRKQHLQSTASSRSNGSNQSGTLYAPITVVAYFGYLLIPGISPSSTVRSTEGA